MVFAVDPERDCCPDYLHVIQVRYRPTDNVLSAYGHATRCPVLTQAYQVPMDLGTVQRKLAGSSNNATQRYRTAEFVLRDVELVFKNAMRYNPPGHAPSLPGTGMAYGAASCAMHGTGIAGGTDTGSGATSEWCVVRY